VTLVLVARHGETDWNAERRFQGHADRPLTARGRAQAAALAERLAAVELAAVVASDLARALRTAEAVAARRGLPVRVERDLREVDVGSWTGRTAAQVREDEPDAYDRWRDGLPGWSGGETYDAMAARTVAAVLRVAADLGRDGRPLLLVGHGGTIRALEAAADREPLRSVRTRRPVVANGSLWAVRATPSGLVGFRAGADPAGLAAASGL
jgi:broad specificity phosphatase PhoE